MAETIKQCQVSPLVAKCSDMHTTQLGFSGSEWIVFAETIEQSQVMQWAMQ